MIRYKCCLCPEDAADIHEIFFGSSGRKLSKKYNLMVPLCRDHHEYSHNINKTGGAVAGRKQEAQKSFCQVMNINFYDVNMFINNSKRFKFELEQLGIHLSGFLAGYLR